MAGVETSGKTELQPFLHQPGIKQPSILLLAREARGEFFECCAGVVVLEKMLDPGKMASSEARSACIAIAYDGEGRAEGRGVKGEGQGER